MGDRTRGWLLRALPPIAFAVGAGSCIPLLCFGLAISGVRFHWWRPPWGVVGEQRLLGLTLALALLYVVVCGLMCALTIWQLRRGKKNDRLPGRIFSDACLVVIYVLIAGWSWSAMSGQPSVLLSRAVAAAWIGMTAGIVYLELKRLGVWRRAARASIAP